MDEEKIKGIAEKLARCVEEDCAECEFIDTPTYIKCKTMMIERCAREIAEAAE